MNQSTTKLPGQVIIKLGICLVTLALFFWVLIMPPMEKVRQLDVTIAETQAIIARQGKLYPLYATIQGKLKRADLSGFPEPQGTTLSLERISDIPALLQEQATAHGLECRAVTPVPDSLEPVSNTLATHCVVVGDLGNVRRFLFTLGGLEYIRRAKALRFENAGGRTMLTMTVLVALSGQGERVAQVTEAKQ